MDAARPDAAGFERGDRVRRRVGSYMFPGVVLAQFPTTLGLMMVAVEHESEAGMLHVFRAADLVRREDGHEPS